ncbi:transcriptional regulator GcvA [Piscinibacter koreensis]|uniref:Transcriptional regulator GcvA n=1 Tax=Piscinibacter koreensis TaxID=2742824 RepID=A0A7Y6TV21_9BURK|nr:transcriptional regulator GcvA [Schlegelella koreensis]NUZ04610.1 transcriptional regulator GcvA [Schlegelella koreensis]
MATHLPSLSALRAFEATSRHLSFTRAATELNLTQTAISHRIKELENTLAVQLFIRRQRGIALTDDGRAYLEAIRPALSQIAAATDSVASTRENRLKVACLSAFALRCLIPALVDFRRRHPDIGIRIAPIAAVERVNLHDVDLAIWYGPDERPELDLRRFGAEEIFPVCTPQLLKGAPPLVNPDDLTHYPVIRTVSPIIVDEWPVWLRDAGAKPASFADEVFCEGLYFSMGATLAGLGVGLGRTSLVAADLASGRLVEPFRVRSPAESSYYVVCRPEKSPLPKVAAFRAWLLERFSASIQAPAPA